MMAHPLRGLYCTLVGIHLHIFTLYCYSKDKHSTAAKAHGREVQKLLGKVDPHLAELASKSEPKLPATNDSALKSATTAPGLSKKRKAESSNSDLSVPKKKHVHGSLEKTLTLSQREQKGLDVLGVHLEECGGKSYLAVFTLTHSLPILFFLEVFKCSVLTLILQCYYL